MSTCETKAGADSPTAEVTSALKSFVSDIKGFQDTITTRLQKQEERLTMLDRKTALTGRPALSTAAEIEAPPRPSSCTTGSSSAAPVTGPGSATSPSTAIVTGMPWVSGIDAPSFRSP